MTRLQRLHLLLFFVTSMNCFSHGTTYWATDVFTSMIVAQYVSGTYAVRNQTFLILTLSNMFPQTFHTRAMWCDWAPSIIVLTFGSMPQEQQTLLLMPQYLLSIRYLSTTTGLSILSRSLSSDRCWRWGLLRSCWGLRLRALIMHRCRLYWGMGRFDRWLTHYWVYLSHVNNATVGSLWLLNWRWLLHWLMLPLYHLWLLHLLHGLLLLLHRCDWLLLRHALLLLLRSSLIPNSLLLHLLLRLLLLLLLTCSLSLHLCLLDSFRLHTNVVR
mmetsp:Transcript_879/g.2025  ORF Transcript_879/g.2025 Transcript_879/m.2025 type:complete len:271 (+) Transcript_879:846-1658(+)